MEFLSSGSWWGLFAGASITFIAYQLGRQGSGAWKSQLQGFGSLLTLAFIILAFIFTGWKGGVAVFVGIIPVAVVGIIIIGLITRK